uniref:Uncharacterized protein n=1 Tax=Pyxicephalus adspersus TaxID=30357 RepID=A0AAV2ZSY6_PYXAD|nr:TPA: hypothetical protein GDO54_004128 [Pyxicephalus adspersus]
MGANSHLLLLLAYVPILYAVYLSPNMMMWRQKLNESKEYPGVQMYRDTVFISSSEDTEYFEMVVPQTDSASGFLNFYIYTIISTWAMYGLMVFILEHHL